MENNINQAPAEYNPNEMSTVGSPVKKIASFVIGAIVVLIILIIIFVVVLPRIGSKKPVDVTLTYWAAWEEAAPLESVTAEFTRLNPHIKINVERQDVKSLGKYVDRLSQRINAGTGPDLFRLHSSWIYELKSSLLALPQDVIKSTGVDSQFYPVVKDDVTSGGAYYGIPIHFDSLALFVNTDLFNKVGISTYPSDWNDVTTDARKLTVKDADGKITTAGIALGTYDNIAHAPDIISLLMIQNGAELTNLNGPAKGSAYDAIDFYTSFAKGDSKVWDGGLENSKLAFAKGNLAMYIGYSWDIFEIKAINPNLPFAVVPVPHIQDRDNTIASYWVEGVSRKTKYPAQAFEFLKYLASKKTMENLYTAESKTRLFGELYPREDMAGSLKTNTLIYPFVQKGKTAKSTIFSSDTYDDKMIDQANTYLGNAINSVVNDNGSPQTAVDTLAQGVSQLIQKYAK